ncbi:carcinoembryonic antigen-related cell adhesion molecule 6-like [Conger conger]|uniref:carcinoembryonic antigen-related cell adhesion molecule 6-like n=1 Tax=Conger conger TaxID=82655 RepID=UPI002A5A86EB|nr:carcinoembryonic antigen-related cell adhesion molecule 6-like [Conger conger]
MEEIKKLRQNIDVVKRRTEEERERTAAERMMMEADNRVAGCSSGLKVPPPGPLIEEGGGSATFTTTVSPAGPELLTIKKISGVKTTVPTGVLITDGPVDVFIQGHREIEVGNRVVLTCSASSISPATFTWTFNGKETGVLTEEYTIANATIDHGGTYTCLATNSVTGLSISSAPHLLTVTVPTPLGAILGGTFGALACVALAGGAFVCKKKKKRRDIPCNQDAQAVVYENTKELGGPIVYENLAEDSIDPRSVASENRDDYQELQFKDSATYCTMKSH